jgi:hypothetical protein
MHILPRKLAWHCLSTDSTRATHSSQHSLGQSSLLVLLKGPAPAQALCQTVAVCRWQPPRQQQLCYGLRLPACHLCRSISVQVRVAGLCQRKGGLQHCGPPDESSIAIFSLPHGLNARRHMVLSAIPAAGHLAEDGELAAGPADLRLLAADAAQLRHHLPRHLVLWPRKSQQSVAALLLVVWQVC